jgi:hypothetical protein
MQFFQQAKRSSPERLLRPATRKLFSGYAFGPQVGAHLGPQAGAHLGPQAAAAQDAEAWGAALRLAFFIFFAFLRGTAWQPCMLLWTDGEQLATAVPGAVAIASPPATASKVASLTCVIDTPAPLSWPNGTKAMMWADRPMGLQPARSQCAVRKGGSQGYTMEK